MLVQATQANFIAVARVGFREQYSLVNKEFNGFNFVMQTIKILAVARIAKGSVSDRALISLARQYLAMISYPGNNVYI